jgi:hypothetical protein
MRKPTIVMEYKTPIARVCNDIKQKGSNMKATILNIEYEFNFLKIQRE